MTPPEDDRRRWMTQFVQFYPCRTILREGDEVEIYVPKHCIGRFEDAAVNALLAWWRKAMAQAGDDPRRRPVPIIHLGRLWIVELQTLTKVPAAPRPALVVPQRPATKQLALAWE